jgi:hypothetical protein
MLPPANPADAFVWTTKPLQRIDDVAVDEPAEAALNGTYRWTLTEEEAEASNIPEILSFVDTFPDVMTITLNDGRWTISARWDDGESVECEEDCTFTVSEDRITFLRGELTAVDATFTSDEHGNLQLQPASASNDPAEEFVMTTKPWEKID